MNCRACRDLLKITGSSRGCRRHTCDWYQRNYRDNIQAPDAFILPVPTYRHFRLTRRLRVKTPLPKQYCYIPAIANQSSPELSFLMNTFNRAPGSKAPYTAYKIAIPDDPGHPLFIGPCPLTHQYYIDKWGRAWANMGQTIQNAGGQSTVATLTRGGYTLDEILRPKEEMPDWKQTSGLSTFPFRHADSSSSSAEYVPTPIPQPALPATSHDGIIRRSARGFRSPGDIRPQQSWFTGPPPDDEVNMDEHEKAPQSPTLMWDDEEVLDSELQNYLGLDDAW